MVIPRPLLILVGTLAATCSGAVMKSYPNPPPFEVYGVPEQAPLLQHGISNFLATPMMPIPMQYGADCELDHHLSADFDQAKYLAAYEDYMSKFKKLYTLFPQGLPIYPELPTNFAINPPSADIPCEEENLVIHEGPKKEEIIIPEAPILPALPLPEMPATVISEKTTPCDEVPIPEIHEAPKEEEVIPIIIPEAPMLSPLSLPEMPTEIIEEPQDDYLSTPVLPEQQKIEEITSMIIPEAPVLAPLSGPELKDKTIVKLTPHEEEPKVEVVPILIPEAPMLPPLSMPELPTNVNIEKLPEVKEPVPMLVPTYLPEKPILEENIPDVLPELLMLSTLTLPKLPARIDVEDVVPSISENLIITTEELEKEHSQLVIPEAPMLSPYVAPEFFNNIILDESAPIVAPADMHKLEVIIPDAPEMISVPIIPIVEPSVHSKSEVPLVAPKLFINDHNIETKQLTPTFSAPAPIVVKAPMQIVVHGSELATMSGSADCLYKYLTDRIIANIV